MGTLRLEDGGPTLATAAPPPVAAPPAVGRRQLSFTSAMAAAGGSWMNFSALRRGGSLQSDMIASGPVRPKPPRRQRTSAWDDPEKGAAFLAPFLSSVTLVDVRWLVDFLDGRVMAEKAGVLPAWQQLPPEAPVSVERLRAYTGVDLPILFFSYPWLDRAHPDPTGAMFGSVRPLLRAVVSYLDSGGGRRGGELRHFRRLHGAAAARLHVSGRGDRRR